MKTDCKRRDIYEDTFEEVKLWVERRKKDNPYFRSPNNKFNFPFYLNEYIQELKNKISRLEFR